MKMLISAIASCCIGLVASASMMAQQAKTVVTGKMTDADTGEPVIGGSVILKNSPSVGTISDLDGNYVLEFSDAGGEAILVYSCIGYKDFEQKIVLGRSQRFDIRLTEDTNLLDETVVIGYGSVKKKDLSGAIGSVKGESISKINATQVSQSLQGSIPGLQVTRSSGLPGASATLRVRGVTTMSDSDPLIILDGTPISSIDYINSEDIESITVLKDAASASIYGARAAAGVILVTSKRATEGSLNVNYSGNFSVIKPTRFPSTVSPTRFFEMQNETEWNDSGNVSGQEYPLYSKELIENYQTYHNLDPDTYPLEDWIDVLIKDWAPAHKHNVSLSYGNNVVKTNASISYEDTRALYTGRSYKVFNMAVSNDMKITKFLKIFADIRVRRAVNRTPQNNPLSGCYLYAPNTAAYWEDGRYAEAHVRNNARLILDEGGYVKDITGMIRVKTGFELEPVKNLKITGVFAPTYNITKGKDYNVQLQVYSAENPSVSLGYVPDHETTSLVEDRNDSYTITKQLTANYNFTLGKAHNISLMAGYEDYSYKHETMSGSGDYFELSGYPYLNRAPADHVSVSGSASELAYLSFFGRAMYDYKHRYLFQANIRSDASSRFHKDYRWGTFPSVSAGWVMSEEPWMKNIGPLNFLKIRASYGVLGNERIGTYPYQAIMDLGSVLMDSTNGVVSQMTAAQKSYNINNISWETTDTWDIGLDATLFKSRLSLSFDYYRKTTRDMLLDLDIPDLIGYSNPSQNAGEMYTKGWEFSIGWRDHIGEVNYSINANVSDYRSVMGDLSGIVFDGDQIKRKGSEYNEWYGYLSDGLFLTQEDLDNSPKLNESVQVGDIKFKDVSGPDGVPDGKISPEYDRVLLGGSLPRFVYGGNVSIDWRELDFSLIFNGVGKQLVQMTQKMVFHTSAWQTWPSYIDGNYFSYYNTDEENAKAFFPRLSQQKSGSDSSYNYEMSDYWLFNGAYFRVKNITIGYTLPKKWTNAVNLRNVRVYASVTDPFSIDAFPEGWDPEAAATNAYIARTYNFGINIGF